MSSCGFPRVSSFDESSIYLEDRVEVLFLLSQKYQSRVIVLFSVRLSSMGLLPVSSLAHASQIYALSHLVTPFQSIVDWDAQMTERIYCSVLLFKMPDGI